MRQIILIAHNLRSTHNVGSLFRTAEGLNVSKVWLTGYSPHPQMIKDDRLPHLAQRQTNQIHKTALGAENSVDWEFKYDIRDVINFLRKDNFSIVALEQSKDSQSIIKFQPPDNLAIIVGREVEGLEPEILKMTDVAIEIPMYGAKESFNVVQAAAMALFYCRFAPFSDSP